jgi:hypothetical protein
VQEAETSVVPFRMGSLTYDNANSCDRSIHKWASMDFDQQGAVPDAHKAKPNLYIYFLALFWGKAKRYHEGVLNVN